MVNLKQHTNLALGYFFLVGLLGLFLRLFFIAPLPGNFRYIVHAHSHLALLGWVYIGLTTSIYKLFLSKSGKSAAYLRIFWFTNLTIAGMLFTFPFTGYAFFSILFSTLFLFASYFFAWFFFRNTPAHFKSTASYRCIKAAIIYMIISSAGPWALGAIMTTLGNTSIWYKLSIYFYLHFQYNGWFIPALCGFIFLILEKSTVGINKKLFRLFFLFLNLGIVFGLFLSALWVEPPWYIYIMAGAGAIFQLVAFYYFFRIVIENKDQLKAMVSPMTIYLLKIVAVILGLKILLQSITAVPFFATLSFQYTDFVIGYLHLVFLGLVSISLFAFLHNFRLMDLTGWAFRLYLAGFILSEGLVFYKGTSTWLRWPPIPDYFTVLLLASSLMPLAVGVIFVHNLKNSKKRRLHVKSFRNLMGFTKALTGEKRLFRYIPYMKFTGITYVIMTTIVLVALAIMARLNFPFDVIFYVTVGGQILLLFTVYKVLTDDYKTDKTFDDWYEDHPIGRE